jgi:hypothetical protein
MISNHSTNQHIYLNIYCRLCIAFIDHFVIQSQGPLNLCFSVNNQFPINNWISSEERKLCLKRMFVYFYETCGKCVCYTPSVKLPISWTGQTTGLYCCSFHELGDSLFIFCPVHELDTTNSHIMCIKILRGQKPNLKLNVQICLGHEVGRNLASSWNGQFQGWDATYTLDCSSLVCFVNNINKKIRR